MLTQKHTLNILRIMIIFISFIFVWQMIIDIFSLPSYILPTPLQVLHAFQMHYALLLHEAIPTILETCIGFFLGIILGSITAVLMVFFHPLAFWLLPILIVSQAIPTFAIAPLFVIWFGFGMTSKIMVTVIMIFFPITSAFYDGLKNTDKNWLDLAKIMQGKKWRVFWYIRIPAAAQKFASGLRVAAVIAPMGAVIGEWVGAASGLGFLMLSANARMQTDLLFAALITLMIFALLLYFITDKLLRITISW
jgi:putative hydroxymethylpyrimidine transport system permease protein